MRRLLAVLLVVAPIVASCSGSDPHLLATGAACPVSEPNGSMPPGETRPLANVLGNGELWVGLWPEGRVVFEPDGPGLVRADGSLDMKFWWWRADPASQLTIEGRRLDATAPPLAASVPDGYQGQHFQASGLIFPTPGCWEVTAHAGAGSLTIVTEVVSLH
jgi:hypothetical protein